VSKKRKSEEAVELK